MTTMTPPPGTVTGGVDTHSDIHVAAAVDHLGGVLGTQQFRTTPAGYRRLLRWLQTFGPIHQVGVEGTGSYGAGLARLLAENDVKLIEVARPNRQVRRRHGKSDVIDAIAAARAVRERLRHLKAEQLVVTCSAFRVRGDDDSLPALIRLSMRELAQRIEHLDGQLETVTHRLSRVTNKVAPKLVAVFGIGPDVSSALLVTAGDNTHRLHRERSFAALCGSLPIPATSGKIQNRHRLNRGGDRQANAALWRIVIVRLSHDQRTKDYMAKRLSEGKTKKEVIRCLKRYVAREVFSALPKEALGLT